MISVIHVRDQHTTGCSIFAVLVYEHLLDSTNLDECTAIFVNPNNKLVFSVLISCFMFLALVPCRISFFLSFFLWCLVYWFFFKPFFV